MALICAQREVCIEAQENYLKSTYRNRCEVMGSNGIIDLSIPIIGGRDHHQLYRDVQIAYDNDWQHRHRMSIISCYGSSPFFEHYMPYLEPFYDEQHTHLFKYNRELLSLLIRLMKLDVTISYTDSYEKELNDTADLRKAFKPGKEITEINIGQKKWQIQEISYMRVFDIAYASNSVSCLDLLFNEGPQSKNILRQMIVRA